MIAEHIIRFILLQLLSNCRRVKTLVFGRSGCAGCFMKDGPDGVSCLATEKCTDTSIRKPESAAKIQIPVRT